MNTVVWLPILSTLGFIPIFAWAFFKIADRNIANLSPLLDNAEIKGVFFGIGVKGQYKKRQILWTYRPYGRSLLRHKLYVTSEVGKNQYAYFQESAITQNTKWNHNRIYYVFKWPPDRFLHLWGRVYSTFESKEILEELVQAAEIVESKINSGSVPVPKAPGSDKSIVRHVPGTF